MTDFAKLLSFMIVSAGCSVYAWDAQNVTQVHVIFMNHLDVGYDGVPGTGFVNHILNIYFNDYFPRAITVWKELVAMGYQDKFVYTTHPWLVSLYLDCPKLVLAGITLKCPDASAVKEFERAVDGGAVSWHAGPMNLQTENIADPWLLDFAIQLGKDLDSYFGLERKALVLSQRDVPGMTQAVIPGLVQKGVKAVSVGVNDMTAPPAVPNVFSWRYQNSSVVAMWHPGGYPRTPGPDPSHPGGLSIKDCVIVDGLTHALCFAFRSDNQGPPMDAKEVLGYYDILAKEFPGANIKGSTFDEFVTTLLPFASKLPVVEQEISDTWIQGDGTDPKKTAFYRVASRVIGNCFARGDCSLSDPRVYEASRMLVKLPEHTWGLTYLQDTTTWTNQQLTRALSLTKFRNCAMSWMEQREFLNLTHKALHDHPVAMEIADAWKDLEPKQPDISGSESVSSSTTFSCSGYNIRFSDEGAIDFLLRNGVQWASSSSPLSRFLYRTYNQTDYADLGRQYDFNGTSAGYVKRNMTENAHPSSKWWKVGLARLYKQRGVCTFHAHIKLLDQEAVEKYGAPKHVWISYHFTQAAVDMTLQWFGKSTTRLPEALMLSFEPQAQPGNVWRLWKLQQAIDPMNVVRNGSQYQHGVDSNGVSYQPQKSSKQPGHSLQITSPHVLVVCPITGAVTKPTVFPAPLQPIRSRMTGMAYNLYNNIWDTNFVYWYPYLEEDRDFKANFSLRFT